MNIEVIRKTLFMTRAEAGRLLAATAKYPNGVSETTWNRWEAGKKPLPTDVKEQIEKVVAERNAMLLPLLLSLAKGDNVDVVWNKHCPPDVKVLDWHIEQSVAATLIILGGDETNG